MLKAISECQAAVLCYILLPLHCSGGWYDAFRLCAWVCVGGRSLSLHHEVKDALLIPFQCGLLADFLFFTFIMSYCSSFYFGFYKLVGKALGFVLFNLLKL